MDNAIDVTNEAIARAEAHAAEVWKETAWRALTWLASTRDVFTTDDLWLALEKYYPDVRTHEKRALGALMRRAMTERIVDKTGEYSTSVRPEAHRAIVFHYRSLVRP